MALRALEIGPGDEVITAGNSFAATAFAIAFSGADTVEVFGHYIHTYDMRQSRYDNVTVPIFYNPRQVKLHLSSADVDAALLTEMAGSAGRYHHAPDAEDREKPQHTVYLDAFWIDKYEVTNVQYRECVVAGECRSLVTCDWGEPT